MMVSALLTASTLLAGPDALQRASGDRSLCRGSPAPWPRIGLLGGTSHSCRTKGGAPGPTCRVKAGKHPPQGPGIGGEGGRWERRRMACRRDVG